MTAAIIASFMILILGSVSIDHEAKNDLLKKIEKECKPNQHVKTCLKKIKKKGLIYEL